MNIVQFVPYFPPHKGGLETHAYEWAKYWQQKKYGKCIIITGSENQQQMLQSHPNVYHNNQSIGYVFNDLEILVLPCFDIVSNFPFPKFWTKMYRNIFDYVQKQNPEIIITRTRFFITSFLGGKFAKKQNKQRIHIEHGSEYVKLASWLKNKIAYIYDRIIGKWIFRKADMIVGVSNACKDFVQKNFNNPPVQVIYRGLDFVNNKKSPNVENLKERFPGKIIVGFVGRFYKWKNISALIKAYYDLDKSSQDQIQIVLVGDGEDMTYLKSLDKNDKIYFTGSKPFDQAIALQSQFDIHYHTSAPGGGLASTLLQAMWLGPLIVSTPYEGAKEVIQNNKNGILLSDCTLQDIKKGLQIGIQKLDKKQEFAKINKEIIKKEFNWDDNIKKYYLLMQELNNAK